MIKNPPAKQETWLWSLGWEDPLEKETATQPVFLPLKSHGQRSLVGYSPWGRRVGHVWVTKHTHTLVSITYPNSTAFLCPGNADAASACPGVGREHRYPVSWAHLFPPVPGPAGLSFRGRGRPPGWRSPRAGYRSSTRHSRNCTSLEGRQITASALGKQVTSSDCVCLCQSHV